MAELTGAFFGLVVARFDFSIGAIPGGGRGIGERRTLPRAVKINGMFETFPQRNSGRIDGYVDLRSRGVMLDTAHQCQRQGKKQD